MYLVSVNNLYVVFTHPPNIFNEQNQRIKYMIEKTLALFKPDVAEQNLELELLSAIYEHGFAIIDHKQCMASEELLTQHYENIKNKVFFPSVLEYMTSGPITALILEKENAISEWRTLMGATNPAFADEATIRGHYGNRKQTGATIKNLVHGSDSVENANREIELWFPKKAIES